MPEPAPRRLLLAGHLAWAGIGVLLLAGLLLVVLGRCSVVAIPMALAILPAPMLTRAARSLERKGLPRSLASLSVVLGAVVTVVALLVLVAFQVIGQSEDLRRSMSDGYEQVRRQLDDGPLGLPSLDLDKVMDMARSGLLSGGSDAAAEGPAGALAAGPATEEPTPEETAVRAASITFKFLGMFAFGIIVLFFYVRDGEAIAAWLRGLFPASIRDDIRAIGDRIMDTIGNYVRAQAVVATIDGVLIGLGLFLLGVPLAVPLGVLTFLASFVPIVGAVLAGIAAVLVALAADGVGIAVAVGAMVLIVQQVEGNLLQPWIMGRHVELHPLAVIVLLTLGGTLFGLLGAIVAVPLGASTHVTIAHVQSRLDGRAAATAA